MRLLIALLLISMALPVHAMSPMQVLAGSKQYNLYDFEASAAGFTNSGFSRVQEGPGFSYNGGEWIMRCSGSTSCSLTLTDSHGSGTVSFWAYVGSSDQTSLAVVKKNGSDCGTPVTLTTTWQKISCGVSAGDTVALAIDNTGSIFAARLDYARIPK